ncbi:hypothetical protein SAMN02745127_01843 [Oceanospirillum multiglobuliferum]|uniref:Uncharacterized protein n=1 Tax=Oceanospirillum multiglobuliferum TaxID=64969 RepID=A0A1T4QCK7_9GAMM|nr:DUF6387 family protein [Oceanospirillum multiglobuliferum]OPX56519.1 hypothetical protein BTE48_03590 [Oceanospirillum multiglobuliferum]SKA01367.1 hypothetical protein SAMN02745127_01843 [Oceanospirillum multiglobuliferum]
MEVTKKNIDLSWYKHSNYEYLESCSLYELYQQLSARALLRDMLPTENEWVLSHWEQIKQTGKISLSDMGYQIDIATTKETPRTALVSPIYVSQVEEMAEAVIRAKETMLFLAEQAQQEINDKYDIIDSFGDERIREKSLSADTKNFRDGGLDDTYMLLKERASLPKYDIDHMAYDVALLNSCSGVCKGRTEVHLSIDLAATNKEILRDVKAFLEKYREIIGIYPPEPKNLTIEKVINDRVIPYIDLTIWDSLEGHGILTDALAAQILFSFNNGVKEVRSADKVQRVTAPNAEKALSETFLNKLYAEMAIENINQP